jgi:hypothetical protein
LAALKLAQAGARKLVPAADQLGMLGFSAGERQIFALKQGLRSIPNPK